MTPPNTHDAGSGHAIAAREAIRTPRAAAVAGIAFSMLLTTALVLIRVVVPRDPDDAGEWLVDGTKRGAVVLALNLLPFAGIAFLWFIGVVRDRIGDGEDRFFATVFLGSGLLFIAMLFVTGAVATGLIFSVGADGAGDVWPFGRRVTAMLLNVYAMRMAAVFTISTTTIATRLKIAPRWLTIFGFATGAVLLLSVGITPWVELVFPAWVFVFSIHILVVSFRTPGSRSGTAISGSIDRASDSPHGRKVPVLPDAEQTEQAEHRAAGDHGEQS